MKWLILYLVSITLMAIVIHVSVRVYVENDRIARIEEREREREKIKEEERLRQTPAPPPEKKIERVENIQRIEKPSGLGMNQADVIDWLCHFYDHQKVPTPWDIPMTGRN